MLLNNNLLLPVFLGVVFIWLLVLSIIFYKIGRHDRKLSSSIRIKDYEGQSKKIEEIVKEIKAIGLESNYHIQKTGLVRFNPFADTGGNQSFCLAVLDNNDSGFVISSLHSRETTRLYAKPIKKGKAQGYELSTEEKQAIKNAKKIK